MIRCHYWRQLQGLAGVTGKVDEGAPVRQTQAEMAQSLPKAC